MGHHFLLLVFSFFCTREYHNPDDDVNLGTYPEAGIILSKQ